MGSYTDNLFKRGRKKPVKHYNSTHFDDPVLTMKQHECLVVHHDDQPLERLVSVAIIRNGETFKGFKSHAELRRSMNDEDPYVSKRSDVEGFWTSNERFVTRREGNRIASDAGQCPIMQRDMLSSDINW